MSPSSIRHPSIRCLKEDENTYIDFYSIHIRVKRRRTEGYKSPSSGG